MSVLRVLPSDLVGKMQVPPSKSMAHRLLFAASMAEGSSLVQGLDYSADINATIEACRVLGAKIRCNDDTASVNGLAREGFFPADKEVNCNESGTTLRLAIPLFSISGKEATLYGARRLFERPLKLYKQIFDAQGLKFKTTPTSLTIRGSIQPGEYSMPGNVSSQFFSGLLLALPQLYKNSKIYITTPLESRSYLELTRKAQKTFGVKSEWQGENTLHIPGGQKYCPAICKVEGDWSQGAVPAVLAACAFPGLAVGGLSPSSAQGDRAVLDILKRCGADFTWSRGFLYVKAPQGGLVAPGSIDISGCPDLGPILCTLALFCKGTTRIVNAQRLRIKESDRIATMQAELRKLGAHITSTHDTIVVDGGHKLQSGQCLAGHNDHRVVMAIAAATLIGGLTTDIEDAQAVAKSWPAFFADIEKLGAQIEKL